MNTTTGSKIFKIDNSFLDSDERTQDTVVFTIFLNRPFDSKVLCKLHRLSQYTIMADGAANYFHDNHSGRGLSEIFPDAIVGDLDSIREEVSEYYKDRGVNVQRCFSQDDSDLEKCLNHLMEYCDENPLQDECYYKIVITGGMGGRMDHTLNNIHIIHKFALKYGTVHSNLSLLLLDDDSVGTCILPGITQYHKARDFEKEKGCGIFPMIGEAAKLKTKGFRWNMDENSPPLNFKKFVSSSNEFAEEMIEFETDQIVFFVTTNAIHGKPKNYCA
jgi:thiamine pyrophosphokinase